MRFRQTIQEVLPQVRPLLTVWTGPLLLENENRPAPQVNAGRAFPIDAGQDAFLYSGSSVQNFVSGTAMTSTEPGQNKQIEQNGHYLGWT